VVELAGAAVKLALPSDPIVRAAYVGTAVFTVVAVLAAATNADPIVVATVLVDLVLFAIGCVAFVLTLLRAADRSRTDELSVAGIWWLTGSAPAPVRRQLLGVFGVEVLVALVTASVRPFTGLAFGILVPTYGLGLVGLWAVRLGKFGPRV
jgi:hypothetical protein